MIQETITSRKNELVKEAAKLLADASLRGKKGLFLAEGARLCADAAASGVPVVRLFATQAAMEKYQAYLNPVLACAEQAFLVEEHVAQLLSSTKSPQGVFCVCRMPDRGLRLENIKPGGRYLALESVQDPANLGAVLRTAEALGIDGVILAGECCDCFSPKALRASMGAVFRLPVFQAEGMPETFAKLGQAGFSTFAAVPDGDAVPVTACDFRRGAVAAVGNEGNGLTAETIKASGTKVTIPMQGRAESLNAAASAAILMWEMMRP